MCPGKILGTVIEGATPHLLTLSDEQSRQARGKGAWTRCQILGHLESHLEQILAGYIPVLRRA